MKFTLGFSPCPNDTFMFDALIHKRIDTGELHFKCIIEDVEQLNKRALHHELDITKLSYHAWLKTFNHYRLLQSGSALGYKCGPLVIAKKPLSELDIVKGPVAIPGENTTANMLFKLRYPTARNVEPMIFSDIEDAVLSGHAVAGLIIHENRFTYAQKGLIKILDLGEYWENKNHSAIPLGGIVMKRQFPEEITNKIEHLIRDSIQYAFDHPEESTDFVRQFAQEIDPGITAQHIQLYVNKYSLDLGPEGKRSIQKLIQAAASTGLITLPEEFVLPEIL